ncbi:MAG: F0F1 ATP synthase subunit epsilon [Cardiobacteriaceae bacterium]|nr:F0F1 ATP synthase subunit epsilon [Cardiobacteriaceae bacterium]
MGKSFRVNMVSADRQLFCGEVVSIAATAVTGEIGVLAGHTPLLAMLKPGQVRLTLADGNEEIIYVSGGFLEVQPGQTVILADEAERAENLSEEKIQAARERAEAAMREGAKNRIDYAKAQVELAQATAQLAALKRSKKR